MFSTVQKFIGNSEIIKWATILLFIKSILFLMNGIVLLDVSITDNIVKINMETITFLKIIFSLGFIYFFSKIDSEVFNVTGKDIGIFLVILGILSEVIN